jgi:hypothetical protein
MWLQKYIFEHLTPIEFSKNYPKKTASDKCIVNYKSQAANFCSRLTMFVIEQIINKTNFKERVNMMLIFFALREYLYDHRDFQTAYAIHNAFYSAPIIRLTETWGHFKSTHDFEFRKAKLYEKIFSDKNNFKDTKKLFTALEKAQQPFIPLLNFYCGRIASLQETREQMDDDKFVASFKEIINKIFTPVKKFTVKKLQTDIFYMLRHVDISCQREDQLYQLSFKLEPPRNALEKELMQQV